MQFVLTDFTDKTKLLEWLNHDGNPPKALVTVETPGSRYRFTGYQPVKKHETPVTDEDTLDTWWRDYRASLAMDWQKSPANPYKPKTHKQFLADCLRFLGIKCGTVEQRIKTAIATHPDLYTQSVSA